MPLPPVPENLENIAVVREFLARLREAVELGIESDPVFLSQKGQPGGVPVLDGSTLIPTSELGTGVADSTKVLKGDRTWGTGGGGGGGDISSDGSVPFAANESMGGFKLTNVGTPTVGTDAANKNYVDAGVALAEAYSDLHDRFAATRIVDSTGVAGTDTTLTAAIAALPTDGGLIFLKQGSYTISSSQVLPDKDIIIVGAGIDATIINFTGTGTFFSSAFARHYTLRNLSIHGGSLNTAQKLFVSTGTGKDVYFVDITVDGFNHIIDDTGGTSNTFTFTDVEMDLPAFDLTSSFYKGVSSGTVIWNYTSVTLAEASRESAGGGAFLGSPKWVVDHSYIGGPPPSAISDFRVGQAIFDGLRADAVKFFISGNKSQIYGLEGADCVVYWTGTDLFISHSYFKRVNGIGFENQLFFNDTTGDEIHIADSTFDGGGNVTTGLILTAATAININSCRIKNFTVNGIFIGGTAVTTGTVIGNTFSNVTAPVNATDTNAAVVYDDNYGFSGSTVTGGDSVVNDIRRKDVVGGTTTNGFVDEFAHVNTKGLMGVGSIRNTGGSNTLTLQITAIDVYGTTDTLLADVLPGAATTWSMADAVGTALPPFISYTLAVKSTSSGNATTFTLHHATTGAY